MSISTLCLSYTYLIIFSSDVESVGGAKQAVMSIFFCGGGAYPHYYITE